MPAVKKGLRVEVTYQPADGKPKTQHITVPADAKVRDALQAAGLATDKVNVHMSKPTPVGLDEPLTDGARLTVAERPRSS